ncbi:MAG: ABC transporter ATP-binding protein [Candidatus Binatia bacterium]
MQGLTRKYGEFVAVDNVSFSISRGEIVGLLGHNGAGKTTVMRMLTGYLEPSAGAAWIGGMEISDKRLEIQQKIGYLPENSPLYPDMTVLQYLAYVAGLRAIPDAETAIKRVVVKTALADKALDPVSTLSKGYKQRLAVAQAIIHDPEILILDEPTSGLDPSQILEMRSIIKALSKKATVILSTHILQEIEAVCDRVIIMVQGRIGVDANLNELQRSNRLVVSVKNASDEVPTTLSRVPGVKALHARQTGSEGRQYVIELNEAPATVAPWVAKTAVERGWELYRLSEERRTLEAVFREVNEEGSHVA